MMKLIREFDDFNWVREIDPQVYFTDIKANRFYGVEILNGLLEAMKDCEVEERIPDFLRAEKVFVNSSGYYPHNDIWCDSDIDDKVLTLHLDFIDSNGNFIVSWWVTDEMVKLFLLEPNELNESEQDEFSWINKENPLNGVKVISPMGGELTIIDNGGKYVEVTWDVNVDGTVIKGGKGSSTYNRKSVEAMIARGTWRLNESKDEWGWVRDEPLRPTYEFPPKRGDVLICLPGFNKTDDEKFGGGSGYAEGRIIVVGDVTDDYNDGLIIWPDVKSSKQYWDQYMECFDCGIWDRALAYYNK